ncbi:MAG: recombinase family protein [Syntrophorhabdaceae bacterium]
MATWGYIRVSTDRQNTENQRLVILEHANAKRITIDEWIDTKTSSRRSTKERRIDELLDRLSEGDSLIVAELSRLGRSVGQIAILVDQLLKKKIRVICLKESITLNGRHDLQTKVMITMFSLFAEIERDLISERTKEGLARARSEGKLLGRPKGTRGKSKLDGKEKEIKEFLEKGVNRANIARFYAVSFPTLENFIKTRNIR